MLTDKEQRARNAQLKKRLMEINAAGEKLDGGGVILRDTTGRYLSGSPYLLSSDVGRAFRFKNKSQAADVREEFFNRLEQFTPVEMERESPFGTGKSADVFDVHTRTAAEALDIPDREVTPEQRRAAKVVNYGTMYGSPVGLGGLFKSKRPRGRDGQ